MPHSRMDSKLARALADRKASRKPRGRVSVLPPEPEADPEIPWLPLAPGELQRTLAGSDAEYGATVEAAKRAAERAARPRMDSNAQVETRARELLADNLDALSDIIRSSSSTPQQITAAMRALANIAGVGGETLTVNLTVGGLAARLTAGRRQAQPRVIEHDTMTDVSPPQRITEIMLSNDNDTMRDVSDGTVTDAVAPVASDAEATR